MDSFPSLDESASALCDASEEVATTTFVPGSLPLFEESTLALQDAIEETTSAGLLWRWCLKTLWDPGLWSGVSLTVPGAQWYFQGLIAFDMDLIGHAVSHYDFSEGDLEFLFLAMPTSLQGASSQHLAALVTELEQVDSMDLPLVLYTSLIERFLQSSQKLAVLGTVFAQLAFERLFYFFATSLLVRLLQYYVNLTLAGCIDALTTTNTPCHVLFIDNRYLSKVEH